LCGGTALPRLTDSPGMPGRYQIADVSKFL